MQEKPLSKACFFFMEDEVLFRSHHLDAREGSRLKGLDHDMTAEVYQKCSLAPHLDRDWGWQHELELAARNGVRSTAHSGTISDLTSRNLTHAGDRFDALAGILPHLYDPAQTPRPFLLWQACREVISD